MPSALSVSEYYNVALSSAVDKSNCNAGVKLHVHYGGKHDTRRFREICSGNGPRTARAVGELPNSVSSFTAGSQSNITWQLLGTDLYDGTATEAGIYNATSAD